MAIIQSYDSCIHFTMMKVRFVNSEQDVVGSWLRYIRNEGNMTYIVGEQNHITRPSKLSRSIGHDIPCVSLYVYS